MAEYDFSTLNSSDLEELVCDLLNSQEQEFGTTVFFKTFKEGKDKGIDFLNSTSKNIYETVGQVKHYFRSGFDVMLKGLINDESKKVEKLNPDKYIFATSVDLSVGNTVEIYNTFDPFIKSLSDIYGKKELNRLLEKHPNILDNHFKLWYSSTNVLKKILNYQIEGRSNEFQENDLKKRLRLYVQTAILTNARKALEVNNFVIITGEPGVGKTTTAELLLYDYIKDGYSLGYIYDDIKEVEKILANDDSKQIFYFDDFLGHNSAEISKAKMSESALINVLRRISNGTNKKIIFTTRTFILQSAVEESEKLRHFKIKTKESTLQLSEYNKDLKEKLLFNHIEESEIDEPFKLVLKSDRIKNFIINHKNFSPRSVEFITSKEHVNDLSVEEFEKYIYPNFNSPDEIWRHAYEQQITDIERILLNTMLSFGDSVDYYDLEIAFNSRLNYEAKFNNLVKPMNAFNRALSKLEGGFIVKENIYRFQTDDNANIWKFINPSLVDFLIKYLQTDLSEVLRISESATFLLQLTQRLFPLEKSSTKSQLPKLLKKRISENFDGFQLGSGSREDRSLLIASILFHNYTDVEETETEIIDFLDRIKDWSFLEEESILSYYLAIFLREVESDNIISKLSEIGMPIFEPVIMEETDLEKSIGQLEDLTDKFDFDFITAFSSNEAGFDQHFSDLLNEKIDNDIEELLSYSNAQDFVDEKIKDSKSIRKTLINLGIKVDSNFSRYSEYDWWEIGTNNYFQEQMEKDD